MQDTAAGEPGQEVVVRREPTLEVAAPDCLISDPDCLMRDLTVFYPTLTVLHVI